MEPQRSQRGRAATKRMSFAYGRRNPTCRPLAKGGFFGLLKAIPNALEIKGILKQGWWQFLGTAWKMIAGEGGGLTQMARLANGTIRHQKAIYEGDTREGFLFVGQATGAIHDLPSVKELIDRIIAEAEGTLRNTQGKVVP
jgi:NAD(P)H-dependent flavin oxidoreductase YrpB (nitropropane dioxygenase family)